jgi:hypothetical protein
VVQYSDEILDTFGAPKLSKLTVCGAKELPELPNYLSAALWNYIANLMPPDRAVLHLDLAFLRRTRNAADEYNVGRTHLLHYIEGLAVRQHRLDAYLSSLNSFEQCLGSLWQAAELFNRMEHRVLGTSGPLSLYNQGEASDLERINLLNNIVKHFNAGQAEQISTSMWLTNTELRSVNTYLTFDELHENILALFEIARQTFIEIPKEAAARSKTK